MPGRAAKRRKKSTKVEREKKRVAFLKEKRLVALRRIEMLFSGKSGGGTNASYTRRGGKRGYGGDLQAEETVPDGGGDPLGWEIGLRMSGSQHPKGEGAFRIFMRGGGVEILIGNPKEGGNAIGSKLFGREGPLTSARKRSDVHWISSRKGGYAL